MNSWFLLPCGFEPSQALLCGPSCSYIFGMKARKSAIGFGHLEVCLAKLNGLFPF